MTYLKGSYLLRTVIALIVFAGITVAGAFFIGTKLYQRGTPPQNPHESVSDRRKNSKGVLFYDGIDSGQIAATENSKQKVKSSFTVEVGIYDSQEKASTEARVLTEKGFDAFVTPKKDEVGRVKYYVRIGVVFRESDAKGLAQDVTKKLGRRARVSKL